MFPLETILPFRFGSGVGGKVWRGEQLVLPWWSVRRPDAGRREILQDVEGGEE